MILIQTYNPKAILRLLPDAGVSENQVTFNTQENSDIRVIVKVGGQGVHHTHCYVQQHYNIPIISLLDPAGIWKDEMTRVFIIHGLQKAAAIDRGEASAHKLGKEALIIPTLLKEVVDFFNNDNINHLSPMSVDIECDPSTHELTCIGFAVKLFNGDIKALVIPLQHETERYWSEVDEASIWKLIATQLSSEKPKLFQNYIFDCMILSRLGLEVNGTIYDTMTLNHLIHPEWPKGLADMARIYLYCDVWKTLPDYTSNHNLWQYNGRDAIYTLMIHQAQLEQLNGDPTRLTFYGMHLCTLHTEILRLCERGLIIDNNAHALLTQQTKNKVTQLLDKLQEETKQLIPPKVTYTLRKGSRKAGVVYCKMGTHTYETISATELNSVKQLKKLPFPVYEQKVNQNAFNPSSPLQVKELILALGHKVPSKRGKDTTDELSLKKLMNKTKHPLYRLLLEHREHSKLLTTYCHLTLDPDERLRFSMTLPGTVTSRFSSKQTPWGTGCNIQNIPKIFRKIIIPDKEHYVLLNVDFKQADPHVVAWLSGEQKMLDIMDAGGDLHAYTASAIAGRDITSDINYNKDTSIERKLGKACNNALNYGMGALRFADQCFKDLGLILSEADAKKAIEAYFALYPNIKKWHRSIEAQIYKVRRLETPMGRIRYFHGPLTYKLVQNALAYIPPTVVSDALNLGWLEFVSLAPSDGLRVEALMQCHDSLLLQVHRDDLDKAATLLLQCMEGQYFTINGIDRHFDADISFGTNWGDLKSWRPGK